MLNNPGRYAEKRKDKKGGIPACPLMSINQESERLCPRTRIFPSLNT